MEPKGTVEHKLGGARQVQGPGVRHVRLPDGQHVQPARARQARAPGQDAHLLRPVRLPHLPRRGATEAHQTGEGRVMISDILGCGFPVKFEFPPLPSKPSSVCLATEFA